VRRLIAAVLLLAAVLLGSTAPVGADVLLLNGPGPKVLLNQGGKVLLESGSSLECDAC
jgi:hypothetical protein